MLPGGPWRCLPPSKTQWIPQLISGVALVLPLPPSLDTLGGIRVPPGALDGCGVVWWCHLGVLLTAVLRGGRRRAGRDPGLHPEAAVRGAARAAPAPAKWREAIGKLRHAGGATPCTPPTPLHPYLWGWGSSHPLLESEATPWGGQWVPGNSRRGQGGWWWSWHGAGGCGGCRGLCPPLP